MGTDHERSPTPDLKGMVAPPSSRTVVRTACSHSPSFQGRRDELLDWYAENSNLLRLSFLASGFFKRLDNEGVLPALRSDFRGRWKVIMNDVWVGLNRTLEPHRANR
jgi:hypothetical protein